jgi:hypothetical protein
MSEIIKCEKCGSEMKHYKKDSTAGMICESCGWGWVTTQFDEIYADETIYSVSFSKELAENKKALSLISHNTPNNFLTAKKLIENNEIILTGKASTIIDFLKDCKESNIEYKIEPAFPHEV